MHPGSDIAQVCLCQVPVDFRKSIDDLSAMVEQTLKLNLFEASLFVFAHSEPRVHLDQVAVLASQRVLPLVQAVMRHPGLLVAYSRLVALVGAWIDLIEIRTSQNDTDYRLDNLVHGFA